MNKWQAALKEIEASGLTVAEVATRCNAQRTTVSDIRHGRTTQPKYELGVALLALHKRVTRGKK